MAVETRDHVIVALEKHVNWMHHYIVALESRHSPEVVDECVLEANDAMGGSDVDPLAAENLADTPTYPEVPQP